jgi:hypothetical protein
LQFRHNQIIARPSTSEHRHRHAYSQPGNAEQTLRIVFGGTQRVATTTLGGTVQIWDLASGGKCPASGSRRQLAIAFAATERLVTFSRQGLIDLNADDGRLLVVQHRLPVDRWISSAHGELVVFHARNQVAQDRKSARKRWSPGEKVEMRADRGSLGSSTKAMISELGEHRDAIFPLLAISPNRRNSGQDPADDESRCFFGHNVAQRRQVA